MAKDAVDDLDGATRSQARKALLAEDQRDLFVPRARESVGLAPDSAPGRWLGALAECGDAACSCCRLNDPRSRPAFREHVVRYALEAARGDPIRYVSLSSGLLLTDAEILSGIIEAGGALESITLVDSQYAAEDFLARHAPALAQLARFFAPAACLAYHSVRALETAAAATAHIVIACDAGEAVTRSLPATASALLMPGGAALTMMNGGRFGSTTRAWMRPRQRHDDGAHGGEATDVAPLVEVEVPREPGAGPAFPPHMAW